MANRIAIALLPTLLLALTGCDAVTDEVSDRARDAGASFVGKQLCKALDETLSAGGQLAPSVEQAASPEVMKAGSLAALNGAKTSSENYERLLIAFGPPDVENGKALFDESLRELNVSQTQLDSSIAEVEALDASVTAEQFRSSVANTEADEAVAATNDAVRTLAQSSAVAGATKNVPECLTRR